MSEQPKDPPVDQTVDDDDQDSEPTMMAPDDRRPDGTVADLHGDKESRATGAGPDRSGTGAS
jgi:hypothetical protein